MFTLNKYELTIDRPRWLEILDFGRTSPPPIEGGTTIFAGPQKRIVEGEEIDCYSWTGVCTSNGGNFWHKDGNEIKVQFQEDSIAIVRATMPGTDEKKEFIITFGLPEEEEGNSMFEGTAASNSAARVSPTAKPGTPSENVSPPTRSSSGI